MEKVQIHYEPDTIYAGQHPDQVAQAIAEGLHDDLENKQEAFQDFLDTAPNLNEEYQPALTRIKERFAEDGLEISPIFIIDHDTHEEAQRVLGAYHNSREMENCGAGGYSDDRALVDDDPTGTGHIRETFGTQVSLGTAIHEAAHSTAREHVDVVSSKVVEQKIGDTVVRNRVFSSLGHIGGFNKYRQNEKEIGLVGSFWEEAFADLTRVRYSMELGVEPRLHRAMASSRSDSLTYISESADPAEAPEGNTVLPDRFATAISDDGISDGLEIAVSTPAFAGYGLELLDAKVPGLFKEMQASRNNPSRQREVIKIINGVRPGLYRELRDLPYSPEGFRKGLEAIQIAVGNEDSSGKELPAETTDNVLI
jgi:hypothetical protein